MTGERRAEGDAGGRAESGDRRRSEYQMDGLSTRLATIWPDQSRTVTSVPLVKLPLPFDRNLKGKDTDVRTLM